jgi:hypothetical protein
VLRINDYSRNFPTLREELASFVTDELDIDAPSIPVIDHRNTGIQFLRSTSMKSTDQHSSEFQDPWKHLRFFAQRREFEMLRKGYQLNR